MKKVLIIALVCFIAPAIAGNGTSKTNNDEKRETHKHSSNRHRHKHRSHRTTREATQVAPALPPDHDGGYRGIRLSAVLPAISRRIHTLEENIKHIPEHLQGFVAKFRDNHDEMQEHYRKGGKAIEKKTYQRIDEGLKHLERRATTQLPEVETTLKSITVASRKELFDRLPELDDALASHAQKLLLKKTVQYFGFGAFLLFMLQKAYQYYQVEEVEPYGQVALEDSHQNDEESDEKPEATAQVAEEN